VPELFSRLVTVIVARPAADFLPVPELALRCRRPRHRQFRQRVFRVHIDREAVHRTFFPRALSVDTFTQFGDFRRLGLARGVRTSRWSGL